MQFQGARDAKVESPLLEELFQQVLPILNSGNGEMCGAARQVARANSGFGDSDFKRCRYADRHAASRCRQMRHRFDCTRDGYVRMNMRYLSALTCGLLVVTAAASGCAAIHPIKGIPVEQIATSCGTRSDKSTIDLSLLVQSKPDQYRVGPDDVLSVYVPGVLGQLTDRDDEVGEAPPINQPQSAKDIPTLGFPLTVRGDGTLPLPQVAPIHVSGMTLSEVEQAILQAYTVESHVLNGQRARVLVSLARPREYEIVVVRQEKTSDLGQTSPGVVNIGRARKGTARTVRLEAYENDVLHALAKEQGVDGLPGLDAENTIYIIRRRNRGDVWPTSGCNTEYVDNPGFVPSAGPSTVPVPNGYSTLNLPPMPSGRYAPVQTPQPYTPSLPQQSTPYTSPAPFTGSSRFPVDGGTPQGSVGPTQLPAIEPQPTPAMVPGHTSLAPIPTVRPGHTTGSQAPASPYSDGFRPLLPSPDGVIRGQSPSGHWPLIPGHSPAAMGHSNAYPMETTSHGDAGFGAPYGSWQDAIEGFDPTVENPHVIKIPVRLAPGERPNFTEQDIILQDGDIVFIESRDTEVFYTAGLLGGGQWQLPRDYDLRLLEAISIAQGPQNVQTVGNASSRAAINADVTVSGSKVVVMRTIPGGARVPIETSIYKAIKCPGEHNIVIQPGDMIYLQYTCSEGVLAFFERHLLESALFGLATGFVVGNN